MSRGHALRVDATGRGPLNTDLRPAQGLPGALGNARDPGRRRILRVPIGKRGRVAFVRKRARWEREAFAPARRTPP